MKVLVIEDNPVDLKLLTVLLRASGHEFVAWTKADGALAEIRVQLPDVVLLDLNLAGIDGLELVRAMRALQETHAIPVLAITAYALRYTTAEVLDAGCSGIVLKPVDTRHLVKQMQALCARRTGEFAREPPAGR